MFFVVGTNLDLNFGFIGNGWVKLASFSKYMCVMLIFIITYYYLLLLLFLL